MLLMQLRNFALIYLFIYFGQVVELLFQGKLTIDVDYKDIIVV